MNVTSYSPMWTDVATALATIALAILAVVSAYFALRLWIEARNQFGEAKRSTDTDIALRMLARCDSAEVREAEAAIMAIYKEGNLASRDVFKAWRDKLDPASRLTLFHHLSAVTSTYEHVGIVVRLIPAVEDMVVDYLCGRTPGQFRVLKIVIDEDRETAAETSCEFERLANRCEKYAQLHYPSIYDGLRSLGPSPGI